MIQQRQRKKTDRFSGSLPADSPRPLQIEDRESWIKDRESWNRRRLGNRLHSQWIEIDRRTVLGRKADRGGKLVVLLVNRRVQQPGVQQSVGNVENEFVEKNKAAVLKDLKPRRQVEKKKRTEKKSTMKENAGSSDLAGLAP